MRAMTCPPWKENWLNETPMVDKLTQGELEAMPLLIRGRIDALMELANKHGWLKFEWQKKSTMLSFFKEDQNNAKDVIRINVYYTRRTVGTCLNHPTQGKTQLFRRNVNWEEMEKLFINPRTHTRKGYKTRK